MKSYKLFLLSLLLSAGCVTMENEVLYHYIGGEDYTDLELDQKMERDVFYCENSSKEIHTVGMNGYIGTTVKINEIDIERCMYGQGWESEYLGQE